MSEQDDASGDQGAHPQEPQNLDKNGPSDEKPAAQKNDNPQSGDDKESDEDEPPFYKRPLFWIIAGAVALILGIGLLLWWLHARQYESTDDAFIDAHIVRLSPQVSGRLVWIAQLDNRHIKAGQLLAVVEPTGPEAQLEQARAGVAEADAGIAQAQGKLVQAIAQRSQSAANAEAPAADAARAARNFARYRELARIDKAAAADTQIDQARAEAERSAAQATAARREVNSAAANIEVARKAIEAAQAQRRTALARVSEANVTVGDLRIVAPIDGQVVQRNVNIGSTVSPQSQMMAIVPDQIWITANFKETQLALMRVGQHVDVSVDAFPDQKFAGHVDSIQRGAGQAFGILPPQNATGNYVKVVQRVPVRILFDRMPDPKRWPLGPGMSVVPRVKVR
jgi:membrane fusion protein (multidrug efflux system)